MAVSPPLSTLPSLFSAATIQSKQADQLPAITIPSTPSSPGYTLSYPAFGSAISKLTQALQQLPQGDQPSAGDVISCSLINSLEFCLAFFGTTSDGLRCVSAPLNPAYKLEEIVFYLKDTGASILLVDPTTKGSDATVKAGQQCGVPVYSVHLDVDHRAGAIRAVNLKKLSSDSFSTQRVKVQVSNGKQARGGAVQAQDVALVLHTSGTTGKPKGVPLTHLNLLTTMNNICNVYEFTTKDRGLMVMPLFHGMPEACGPPPLALIFRRHSSRTGLRFTGSSAQQVQRSHPAKILGGHILERLRRGELQLVHCG